MSAQWIIKGLDPVGVEKHGVCSHTFLHAHTFMHATARQKHAHNDTR